MPLSESPILAELFKLLRGWNVDPICCDQLRIRHFSFQPDVLISGLLLGFGEKREPVLMPETIRKLIQERLESNGRLEARGIELASSLIYELREVILTPVESN